MSLAVVDELGAAIEAAWRAQDYEPSSFADIASGELEGARLHKALLAEQIVGAVFEGRVPQQADPEARFGQPPVTLFRTARFYISSLFWLDGTTTIHDHQFSGAFQVLSGSSIETRFSFVTSREANDHLRFGELSVNGAALLRPGDTRTVPAGPSYIHSLFHLHRPSISLVVRTFDGPFRQMSYSPAGTAHDPFIVDEGLERVVQVVDLLRRIDDPSLETKVGDLIESSDLYAAFKIVMACQKIKDKALVRGLIGRVRDDAAAQIFQEWSVQAERIAYLHRSRLDVHDPDLRFLLAILLNVHRRRDVLVLAESYRPDADAARQVASWLRRLSEVKIRLQVGGSPWEPSAMGLPAFTPELESALARVLAGEPEPASVEEAAFIGRLRGLPALKPLFVG